MIRAFLTGHAEHDTDVVKLAAVAQNIRTIVQEREELVLVVRVDHRSPRAAAELLGHPDVGVHDLLRTSLPQALHHFERVEVVAAHFARQASSELERMVLFGQKGPLAKIRSAHQDRLVEVEPRRLRENVHGNASRACLVTNQGDVGAIAIEILDVLVNKLHGQALIVQAKVAWSALALGAHKSYLNYCIQRVKRLT